MQFPSSGLGFGFHKSSFLSKPLMRKVRTSRRHLLAKKRAINGNITGKSFSEALILASTIPQYDKRLFIELKVQYMKIASSEHVVYINCSECRNENKKTICVHNMF